MTPTRGIETTRLLIETFVLLDPWWTLRTASVPLWLAFSVEPSVAAAASHLDACASYDEVRLTLFSHGVESIGIGTADRWRSVLGRATKIGVFAGADSEKRTPRLRPPGPHASCARRRPPPRTDARTAGT